MPTVDQNRSAKYSPQFSVNVQAIDIRKTRASRTTRSRLNSSVMKSPAIVPKKRTGSGFESVSAPA